MADTSITYDEGLGLQTQRDEDMAAAAAAQQAQVLRAEQVRARQTAQRIEQAKAAVTNAGQNALMTEAEAIIGKLGPEAAAAVITYKFIREHKFLVILALLLVVVLASILLGFQVYLFHLITNPDEALKIGLAALTDLFSSIVKTLSGK